MKTGLWTLNKTKDLSTFPTTDQDYARQRWSDGLSSVVVLANKYRRIARMNVWIKVGAYQLQRC